MSGSQYGETDFGDGWILSPSQLGRLPLDALAAISEILARHTTTPADHAWFLASEIDFDSTLIGGSRQLIDAILSSDDIEAAEVTEDTDLMLTSDAVNPPSTDIH